jgi:hypothetical protein
MATSAQRKLVELSIDKKKEILDRLESGTTGTDLAKEYGVAKSTISAIKKNRDMILLSWQNNCSSERKRAIRSDDANNLNSKMMDFYHLCRQKNIPLTGAILQEKAKKIAGSMGLSDFKASNGWLEKFRLRNNIHSCVLSGESADVDTAAVSSFKSRVPFIIADYSPENIFNADETALFFRALPKRSLVQRGDNTHGGKLSKERLSVLLAASMAGEKLKPLVIGHAAYPRAFKINNINVKNLPVDWKSNKKAWMTSALFSDWLRELNSKMRCAHRKILLFIDNAPSHPDIQLSHIMIRFLPPCLTSAVQPLDQGVINNFKQHYRKFVIQHLVSIAETCPTASDFVQSVTVLDAIRWLVCAWKCVSADTIQKCFRRAGFIKFNDDNQAQDDLSLVSNCILIDVFPLLNNIQWLQGEICSPADFAAFDNSVQVHTAVSESADEILAQIMAPPLNDPGSEEEDHDEEEPLLTSTLSWKEAIESAKNLSNFLLSEAPAFAEQMFEIESALQSLHVNSKTKQTKITDFFS